MTSSLLVLDAVLAVMLPAIALSALSARDLFQSIVLFIIFGMLLGIAWCRLDAVDVALAEVAIGAGLTGALLLNTLSATQRRAVAASVSARSSAWLKPAWPQWASAAAAVLFATLFFGGLAVVLIPLARSRAAATISVGEALPHSGVTNPVTAVLLNFRAHDTLLEVGVLLAAVFAVLPLSTNASHGAGLSVGPVLRGFVRLLVPLAALVATYVLWAGTRAPGGAFQAAAILAAGGVLMIVCGARPPSCEYWGWRVLLAGGLVVFLLIGMAGIMARGYFLEFPSGWAGPLIMLIETALTASIALILVELFQGTSSRLGPDHQDDTKRRVRGGGRDEDGIGAQEPSP